MGYVTVLKTNCTHIDQEDFMFWLRNKTKKWWNSYGLSKTGEHLDQNDESTVKSFIPEAIENFNSKGYINSGNDVGCYMCLLQMIGEYLREEHEAKDDIDEEVYSETHLLIVKK